MNSFLSSFDVRLSKSDYPVSIAVELIKLCLLLVRIKSMHLGGLLLKYVGFSNRSYA